MNCHPDGGCPSMLSPCFKGRCEEGPASKNAEAVEANRPPEGNLLKVNDTAASSDLGLEAHEKLPKDTPERIGDITEIVDLRKHTEEWVDDARAKKGKHRDETSKVEACGRTIIWRDCAENVLSHVRLR